jgi:ornithine--oxo-acid transaminase
LLDPTPPPTPAFERRQLTLVRGMGLLNAVVVKPLKGPGGTEVTAWDVCVNMAKRGVLAKPTHKHIIRLAPPLVIKEDQVLEAVERIDAAFTDCGM